MGDRNPRIRDDEIISVGKVRIHREIDEICDELLTYVPSLHEAPTFARARIEEARMWAHKSNG